MPYPYQNIGNLQNIPLEMLVVIILFILLLPALIIYIRRSFEVTEITLGPPWIKLARKAISPTKIYHNLPQPDYGRFIGREKEIAQITKILRPYPVSQHALVTIDGVGGVGKSSLALEIAHRHLNSSSRTSAKERFNAIIWISAKQSVLKADGIKPRQQMLRTLQDICYAIAVAIDDKDLLQANQVQQTELARKVLTQQRTLLIVDNLETVDDEAVMDFLRELPAPSKAIITTRHRMDVAYPIRLTGMEWKDARLLIAEEASKRNISLDNDISRRLYDRTGGVPLAIVWSIGQMGLGYTPESVLVHLSQPTGDIARFCFENVVESIRNRPSYKLLLALSLVMEGADRQALGSITGLLELERDDGLVELEKLSLVNREGAHFNMLPLTREYVQTKLAQEPQIKDLFEYKLQQRTETIPLSDIMLKPSLWWQRSSLYEISVPVGIRQDGQLASFLIGTRRGASLVVGRTGSGKTNFMWVLLTSFALNYSPDELRLWIVDPNGEYKGFWDLPHTNVVATGNTTTIYERFVQNLQEECDNRRKTFREVGAANIDDIRQRGQKGIPRLVVVIEEMMFWASEDSVEIVESLTNIVRLSRSLGIHFIFVSQSARFLNPSILNQMSNKILFSSSEDDAQFVLGQEFEKARLLRRPGEAILISQGDVEHIQVAYLPFLEQDVYMRRLKELAESRNIDSVTKLIS